MMFAHGSRALADRHGASFSAIAIPKDHPGRLAYVTEFLEEAKGSGAIQRALKRGSQHCSRAEVG
jgi:hypothetical protein